MITNRKAVQKGRYKEIFHTLIKNFRHVLSVWYTLEAFLQQLLSCISIAYDQKAKIKFGLFIFVIFFYLSRNWSLKK